MITRVDETCEGGHGLMRVSLYRITRGNKWPQIAPKTKYHILEKR